MKNLSLQIASSAILKKPADVTNKSNAVVDKSAAAELNNSFQMMLKRQVKNQKDSAGNSLVSPEIAQKTPSLQNNTGFKVFDEKQESNAGSVALVAKVDSASQASDKIKNIKVSIDESDSKNDDVMSGVSAKLIEKITFNAKTLLELEEGVDAKSEETLNNAEDVKSVVLVASFVQAILTPVVNVISLVKTQETASQVAGKNSLQSPNTADAGLQKQKNLDAVLSSTIAQSNSTQSKDVQGSGVKTPEEGSQIDTNIISEQTHWQAAMQRSAVKQAVDTELMKVKLASNITKDSINKEVIVPASYQSAAQNNSIIPTQQTVSSSNIIQAYPEKSGWDQAISQKVVWMVGASEQLATLTLNPPDLGPLQVVISVNNDRVDTTFMSDSAEVRQALQDGMANLREKLSESGIQLGQASVNSGGQPKQEYQQSTQNQLLSQHSSSAPVLAEEKTSIVNTKVQIINGLVDTFA
jgi:flagellar hook-length control protein FliK